jgi:hypothetical protein
MLHTSVAISIESLSQDKENDIGFIVLYPLLEKKVTSYATYTSVAKWMESLSQDKDNIIEFII